MNKIKPKLVTGIGKKKSNKGTQWYQQNRIYDSRYIAMCIPANLVNSNTTGGGYWYLVYEKVKK